MKVLFFIIIMLVGSHLYFDAKTNELYVPFVDNTTHENTDEIYYHF